VYIVHLSILNCFFDDFLYSIYINTRKKGHILVNVHAFIS